MPKQRRDGKGQVYLPYEKARKYGDDLRAGRETVGSKGTPKGTPLTERQKAYRAGYLKANKEYDNLYLAKNPDKKRERQEKAKQYQNLSSRLDSDADDML